MNVSANSFFDQIDYTRADSNGVVRHSSDLSLDSIRYSYSNGLFPFPSAGSSSMPWCSPDPRGVLFLKDLHISRSLNQDFNKSSYLYTIDAEFPTVIKTCATIRRKGQWGSWINDRIIDAFCELNEAGNAHSVEVWDLLESGQKLLVGGLYLIEVNGVISVESMFSYRSHVSKFAFMFLMDYLAAKGVEWVDIQYMSPHMKSFGAVEMPRVEYLDLIRKSLKMNPEIFSASEAGIEQS